METPGYVGKGLPLCHYNTCWLMKGGRTPSPVDVEMCRGCARDQIKKAKRDIVEQPKPERVWKCEVCGEEIRGRLPIHWLTMCNRHAQTFLSYEGECDGSFIRTVDAVKKRYELWGE